MSELSWSQQLINNPILYEQIEKYANRLVMFIDYVPLVGPMYNATHALNLLLLFWCGRGNTLNDDHDNDDSSNRREKSRKIREKGLTAIVTALIDIFTICLAVGVIAFVCDCLVRIQTFAFVRQVLIFVILVNILALTIGAKIITGQLVIHLTRQLEDVNHVSTSMVKSVTITASAIERTVETTDTFVRYCQNCWNSFLNCLISIVTFPHRFMIYTYNHLQLKMARFMHRTKMVLKRTFTWASLLNIITLGLSGWISNYKKTKSN